MTKTKGGLRKELLAERRLISEDNRRQWSSGIADRLISLNEMQNADLILCYVSKKFEISTDEIFRFAFDKGISAAAPLCIGGDMVFKRISSFDDLELGSFSVFEPKPYCENAVITERTVCLTPALCCNLKGYRIGYGGGFYDRFFEKNGKCIKIGLCPEEFIRDFESDDNDESLDIIVTQKRVISVGQVQRKE